MKKVKIIFLIILSLTLLIPLVFFNFSENYVSAIDNRELTVLPKEFNSTQIDAYVTDRIGFREEMITEYTNLNNNLFHTMVHPTYTYGKDGYVFFKYERNRMYDEYIEEFVISVTKMKEYCEGRNIPFILVFDPSKTSVYSEYISDGVNYDNSWIQKMFAKLDENEVPYVDNLTYLEELHETEQVFNKSFDAGHWNDVGAFYGTNNLLAKIKEYYPNVQINELSDFSINENIETTLPVSKFPINEIVPVFELNNSNTVNLSEDYITLLNLNDQFHYFHYLENHLENSDTLPKTLVFQGSYLNSRQKYLQNNFQTYIAVHNYDNVLDLDYYVNIYQPDIVVFEVTEYTINEQYFSFDKMKSIDYQPSLSDFNDVTIEEYSLNDDDITVESEGVYFQYTINDRLASDASSIYLKLDDKVYDVDVNSLTVIVDKSSVSDKMKYELIIVTKNGKSKHVYNK